MRLNPCPSTQECSYPACGEEGKAVANRVGYSSEVWSSELENLPITTTKAKGSKLSEPSTSVRASTAGSSVDLGWATH